ncbi:MAG: rod-binding protein [Bacillota bacterium]
MQALPDLSRPAPALPRAPGAGSRSGSFRDVLDEAGRAAASPSAALLSVAPGDVPFAGVPHGRAGLRWAAEQLEARLWAFVLKDAFNGQGGGLFGRSFAGQVHADWFTEAMAGLLASSGAGQLADQLVEEFSGVAEGVSRPRGNSGGTRGVAAEPPPRERNARH